MSQARIALLLGVAFSLIASPLYADAPALGVNIVNPYKFAPAELDAMLMGMQHDGVKVLRASITLDEKGVEFAERAWKIGIRIEWLIFRFGGFEPGKSLSSADTAQFRSTFTPILNKLEAKGISLAAFELGNEINLGPNNLDIPRPSVANQAQLGLNDLEHNPDAQRAADGFIRYLEVLNTLKDIRDHSKLNRDTPILTAGLGTFETADGPFPKAVLQWWRGGDIVSINATIEFMRHHGLDNLVDGYAVHVYPPGDRPGDPVADSERKDLLGKYVLGKCAPVRYGRPCWITEWGFNNASQICPIDDTNRTALVSGMIDMFRPYVKDGRLAGLFAYAWNDLPGVTRVAPLTLYRCGALTESGKLMIEPKLFK